MNKEFPKRKGVIMRQAPECRSMNLRDSLLELASWGSPLDVAFAMSNCNNRKLVIEQSGDSQVFELEDGRIAYMRCVCHQSDLETHVPF